MSKITKVFEVLKIIIRLFLTDSVFRRWSLVVVFSFTFWVYLHIIAGFSILDLFSGSLGVYIGYRISAYDSFGLLPGGKWLHAHYYGTIKFKFKNWYWRWRFIKENSFTFDYTYFRKEMIEGDPTSVREVTGPGCVTFGLGTRKYIFTLD